MSGVAPDVHEEEPATPAPLFRMSADDQIERWTASAKQIKAWRAEGLKFHEIVTRTKRSYGWVHGLAHWDLDPTVNPFGPTTREGRGLKPTTNIRLGDALAILKELGYDAGQAAH